jgi:hydroxyacylglutathione hydrolase
LSVIGLPPASGGGNNGIILENARNSTHFACRRRPAMLQIKSFCFNPFQENTYLLYDESGEAAVVDPGCERREEREMLSNFIAEKHLRVVALVNTHCHIDHVLGNRYVMDTYGVPLLVHPDDVATLKANELFAPMYGFSGFEVSEPGGFLKHGDHFSIRQHRIRSAACAGPFAGAHRSL